MKENYYTKEKEDEKRLVLKINALILAGILALNTMIGISMCPGCTTVASTGKAVAAEVASILSLAYDAAGRELVNEQIEALVEKGKITETQATCLRAFIESIYEHTAESSTKDSSSD